MRLYTLAEARALLPQVIPVLETIRDLIAELRAAQAAISVDRRSATADGALVANPWSEPGGRDRIETLEASLAAASRQLDEWGVELKDATRGLIDFHAERDGQLVYLCYLLGEPDIGHWHTLDGGFAGRQPLGE